MMAKLGDVCTIVSGTTPKTSVSEYWDGDINWITPAELNEDTVVINESKRKITKAGVNSCGLSPFPAGTVILSSRAPIGKTAIAGTEMYCNQGFKNLICSDKIHNKYLFWFLRSKTGMLNSLGRGATFKEISKSIVENIEIPLPDLPTQQRIADTLDKVSEGIEVCRRILGELDLMVKAKFGEMFGDPTGNSFNLSVKPMTEVCEIIDGDRGKNYPNADEFSDEGYCLFLNAKNVTASGFNFDNCMYITKEKDDILRKGKLSRGDVVLTTRGTIGNLAFYTSDIPYEHMRINSGMVILRMNRKIINEVFFIEQFKMLLDDIKQKNASGSAQPQLPISAMREINILLPDIEQQKIFSEFVAKSNKSRLTLQQVLSKIELEQKVLMQKYFG